MSENAPVNDLIDKLMREYAAKAEEVYENRSAGDHTWLGLLASYTMELQKLQKLKRYLIFGFGDCYPEGGWQDFLGSLDSLWDVLPFISGLDRQYENYQVVDTLSGETEVEILVR